MFSDGRTNNQGADAEVSAVRASVGAATVQGDDVPDVQIVAVGHAEAEATREVIEPAVCENTPADSEPSTRCNRVGDLPISIKG
jgi:hypothetical protein